MADVAVKRQIEDLPQEALDYFEDDELRARCFIEKYALWDLEDQLKETHPTQMWERVARALVAPEEDPGRWFEEFSWLLGDFRFVPGGRILHGAGSPRTVTLTNCLVGDTIVLTDDGLRRLDELAALGRTFKVRIEGKSREARAKLTGFRETVVIRTREGYSAECTPDHRFRLQNGRWVPASDLKTGDRIVLSHDARPFGEAEEDDSVRGYAAGLFVGDGTFAGTGFSIANVRLFQAKAELPIQTVADQYGGTVLTRNGMVLLNSRPWAEDMEGVGIAHGTKTVTDQVLSQSSDYIAGFLRGLFDADGSVTFQPKTGNRSITLTQSDPVVVERVQAMLLGFGVKSVIYAPRTPTLLASFPKGVYECRAPYRLVITRRSFETFCRRIGFLHTEKTEKAEAALRHAPFKDDIWSARVSSVEGTNRVVPVFDASVEDVHAFSAGGLLCHNCYFTSVEEDSLEAIFEWCKKAARTYSFGGGNGVDIGRLRPQGTPVHNAARTSSGAVSFMELFSTTTGTIGQHGRRGALMITCP
ncbi:MAG: LAGLIDADG family homing endonuclease, partial [Thermoplasmata archaeon]